MPRRVGGRIATRAAPRGWRPSRRGPALDPPSGGDAARARAAVLNAADVRASKRTDFSRLARAAHPVAVVVFDTPNKRRLDLPAGVPRHFAAPPAANTRRRDEARRGANFVTNAMPFFAFMVGGSYGRACCCRSRHREAPASTSRVASRSQHALTTRTRRTPARITPAGSQRRARRVEDVTDVRAPSADAAGAAEEPRAVRPGAENEARVTRRKFFALFFVRLRLLELTRDVCDAAFRSRLPDRRRRRVSENHSGPGEPRESRRDGARPEAVGGARGETAKVLGGRQDVV